MPPCEGGYKEFRLGNLFDITTSKSVDKDGLIPIEKTVDAIQFIGRTQVNNGLQGYTKRLFFNPNPAQTFSIIQVGDSVMQYRESEWYASQNIFLLKPRLSKLVDTKLYIIGTTNKALMIFNGGYNIYPTLDKLKDLLITLPTTAKGEIDFQFMESRIRELEEERMRELEEERMRELEAYLTAAGFANCDLTPEEQGALRKFSNGEVKLCAHNIIDTFHVANTHNILKSDVVFNSGTTPYVTASASNNSIVSRISYKQEMIEQGNSIMIGGKTLVITYQPDAFFSNDSHNLILRPKNIKGENESCELFAVTALYKSLAPKYSWGDSISKQKIQIDKVYLPLNTDNEIDYDFMETYISAIKKQIIQQLKDFIAKEHATYQQVIEETK